MALLLAIELANFIILLLFLNSTAIYYVIIIMIMIERSPLALLTSALILGERGVILPVRIVSL